MKRSTSFALALVLAACTFGPDTPVDDDDQPAPDDGADADAVLRIEEGSAGGPGISIDQALARSADSAVLVNGALFIDGGDTLLCEAIAESFPPQCGGARLRVEGFDPTSIPNLQVADGVRWAESVQLFGRVEPAS